MIPAMRIPITKYGMPQAVICPVLILVFMLAVLAAGVRYFPTHVTVVIELLSSIVLIWAISFFRDPKRIPPDDKSLLLAPADGKITAIDIIEKDKFIDSPAIRISIFLSIFNTHINRAPAKVTVENIQYKKGKYKNALNPESAKVNESNTIWMTRTDEPKDKLIVRQISGAIARRIVCRAKNGQKLNTGEKFGMIKFGSRTDLYLPINDYAKCTVKVGDKVKAGLTPLVRYEICPE